MAVEVDAELKEHTGDTGRTEDFRKALIKQRIIFWEKTSWLLLRDDFTECTHALIGKIPAMFTVSAFSCNKAAHQIAECVNLITYREHCEF